jgi:hypothetical protein
MAFIPGESGVWDDSIAWDDTDFWLDAPPSGRTRKKKHVAFNA